MAPDRPSWRPSLGPMGWLVVLLVALPLWPITLPLAGLASVPILFGLGGYYLVRSAVRLGRGLWQVDGIELLGAGQSLAQAVLCGAFLAMLSGIAMNVDVSLAGAPPSIEEKAIGRRRAESGATVGVVAALAAYALDPGWFRRRDVAKGKHEPDPLD